MNEISKNLKILLIIDALAGFIYGIFYLIMPELTTVIRDTTNFDPQFWRLWGGTCLVFGIFCLIAAKRANWENIKILLELGIVWLSFALVINFITLATVQYSWTAYASQWFDNVIISILIAVNCYFYLQESKKT